MSRLRLWVQSSSGESLLAAVLLAAILLLLYAPALSSGFVLVDDHEIMEFHAQGRVHPQVDAGASLRDLIAKQDAALGRFRPLDWAAFLATLALLGAQPAPWHAASLLMGLAAGWLLYAAGRRAGLGFLHALLLACLALVTPATAHVWVRLNLGETRGTLLTALALFAAATAAGRRRAIGWDALLVLCAVGAGLMKESFILVLPGLAAARVLLWARAQDRSWREGAREHRAVVAILLAAFALLLAAAALIGARAGPASAGGQSLRLFGSAPGAFTALKQLLVQGVGLIPVWIWVLGAGWRRSGGGAPGRAIAFAAWSALWIAPQALIYAPRGGMYGRYMLPAAIALAAVNAFALHDLARRGRRWAHGAAVALMLLALLPLMRSAAAYASEFHATAASVEQLVRCAAATAPRDSSLLILYEDPKRLSEQTISLMVLLGHAGRSDLRIYSMVIPPYEPWEQGLVDQLNRMAPKDRPLDLKDLSTVIPLASPDHLDAARRAWLMSVPWKAQSFASPWQVFSFRRMRFERAEFSLTLLTR